MLQFLRNIFGTPSDAAQSPDVAHTVASADLKDQAGAQGAVRSPGADGTESLDDFSRLNQHIPLMDSDDKQHIIVRRETILDQSEKIAGYEFSLMSALQTRLLHRPQARRAYDAALLTRLSLFGVNSLLGHRLAFINLSIESLDSALLNSLPPLNTVLMFDPPPPGSDWDGIMNRFAALQRKGFSCGLRVRDEPAGHCPLVGSLDFVQIDITAFDGLDLRSLLRDLRARLKARERHGRPPVRLVARGVPSHDDFIFCKSSHFDLFQGPFVSSRESLHQADVGANRAAIFSILNMLLSDAAFEVIADELKNQPILTYKLLRYLNSPAMGLRRAIDSLTDALVLVGRETFSRWVSLLLFDFKTPGYRERAVTEHALARALTLELLAGKARIPAAPEHLFLIGLFSMLDMVVALPLSELVEKVSLPQPVRDTLLGVASPYADALSLVSLGGADSAAEPAQMAEALQRCGLRDEDYSPVAAAALVCAHQLISDGA